MLTNSIVDSWQNKDYFTFNHLYVLSIDIIKEKQIKDLYILLSAIGDSTVNDSFKLSTSPFPIIFRTSIMDSFNQFSIDNCFEPKYIVYYTTISEYSSFYLMPNNTYGNIEVYYTTQYIETDDSFKFDLSSITKINNHQIIYFHPNFTLFKINCTNPGQVQLNFFDKTRYPDIVWGKRLVYLEENTNYNLRINAYDFSIFLPPMNDYTTIYDKNNNTFLEPDKLIEVHSTSSSSSYSNLHTNKGVSLLAVNTYYSIEQLNNITNEFEWIDNSTGTASIINDNYGFFYSIPEVDNWTHLEVWIETPNNLCGVFSYYGIYNSSKMIFTPITFDLYESTVFATTHHIYVQNAALFTKDKNKHYFISFGVYDLCLNVNIKIKYHRKLNKFWESLSQFNNIPFIINKEHFNKPYIFDNISKEEESTNILLLEKKCSKTDELSLYYNSIFSSQLAKDYSLNTEYKKIEIKTNEYIQLGINEIKKQTIYIQE